MVRGAVRKAKHGRKSNQYLHLGVLRYIEVYVPLTRGSHWREVRAAVFAQVDARAALTIAAAAQRRRQVCTRRDWAARAVALHRLPRQV